MKINKKSKLAERIKNKILELNDSLESRNKELSFCKKYGSASTTYGDAYPDTSKWPTSRQYRILKRFDKNTYFTDNEKNFIINYLIECLVDNQPFDCSSLRPNKYLNE